MSYEVLPIANCPNPECCEPCKVWDIHREIYFVRCVPHEVDMNSRGCNYAGPAAKSSTEAIRLHNLIARPSVSTAELEKLANRIGTAATVNGYAKDVQEVLRTFRDDLRALISKATNGRG